MLLPGVASYLPTSLPCLLATAYVWPRRAAGCKAKMRFWHCHISGCSWALCTGLSWEQLSEVLWKMRWKRREIKRCSNFSPALLTRLTFSTVLLSFYLVPVPSCCFISESWGKKSTLLTENLQNNTNSIPNCFNPTALSTLRNTSPLFLQKVKTKPTFEEVFEQVPEVF